MRFLHRPLLVLTALGALSVAASAGPILWTVSDATFTDGATLTWSFVYDADLAVFSSVNLTISGSSTPAFNVTMTVDDPAFSAAFEIEASTILPAVIGTTPSLYLGLTADMTDAGGVIPTVDAYAGICATTSCSLYEGNSILDLSSGSISATGTSSTPEPAAISLVGSALIGLGFLARKRGKAPKI
jgi:hypothetical protein